jgi:hypothetical protein
MLDWMHAKTKVGGKIPTWQVDSILKVERKVKEQHWAAVVR